MNEKAILRREMRARRDAAFLDDRNLSSLEINANLKAWLDESSFSWRAVAAFLAHAREPNLDPLIRRLQTQDVRVFAPHSRAMEDAEEKPFYEIAPDWNNVVLNARGWHEPGEYSEGEARAAREMDAIFLPGLAFDPTGTRLGHGGGWYDRALADLPARVLTIGICFDFQIVDAVPREAHDCSVSMIVTDKRIVHV